MSDSSAEGNEPLAEQLTSFSSLVLDVKDEVRRDACTPSLQRTLVWCRGSLMDVLGVCISAVSL